MQLCVHKILIFWLAQMALCIITLCNFPPYVGHFWCSDWQVVETSIEPQKVKIFQYTSQYTSWAGVRLTSNYLVNQQLAGHLAGKPVTWDTWCHGLRQHQHTSHLSSHVTHGGRLSQACFMAQMWNILRHTKVLFSLKMYVSFII